MIFAAGLDKVINLSSNLIFDAFWAIFYRDQSFGDSVVF